MYARSGNFMFVAGLPPSACLAEARTRPRRTEADQRSLGEGGQGRRTAREAKNTIAATVRIVDPISDCVGYATKLFTTTPIATATNAPVVHGCPGTGAIPFASVLSRCRTRINPPAVKPKNSQSAKTTYESS